MIYLSEMVMFRSYVELPKDPKDKTHCFRALKNVWTKPIVDGYEMVDPPVQC